MRALRTATVGAVIVTLMRPLAQPTTAGTVCVWITVVHDVRQLLAAVSVPLIGLASIMATVSAVVAGVVFTALLLTATMETWKVGPTSLVYRRPNTEPA